MIVQWDAVPHYIYAKHFAYLHIFINSDTYN